jgi:hypothetical protein
MKAIAELKTTDDARQYPYAVCTDRPRGLPPIARRMPLGLLRHIQRGGRVPPVFGKITLCETADEAKVNLAAVVKELSTKEGIKG